MIESVCELLPSQACDLYGRHPEPVRSGTLLKQYLLDPVLPMLTLLSMSALTVVMLVLVVTAVADMDLRPVGEEALVDPWADVPAGSTDALSRDPGVDVDLGPSMTRMETHEQEHALSPEIASAAPATIPH